MANGVYVAVSGSVSRQRQLEVLAHDMAQVNTTGFKRDGVSFREHVVESARQPASTADKDFVQVQSTHTRLEQGALRRTDNPLDVAISGDGWLRIQTESGLRLTRDGRLMQGRDGFLKTHTGYPVLDVNDQPLALAPGRVPRIEADGGVFSGDVRLGTLGLSRVDPEESALQKDQEGYFLPPEGAPPVAGPPPQVQQGWLESSNVNPVTLMTELIEVQRHFEALHQVISTYQRIDESAARLPR